MDHSIVPRWNDLAAHLLFRVPGRSDVVLRAAEDGERGNRRIELLPLFVGAREMTAQHSVGVVFAMQHHRQVR